MKKIVYSLIVLTLFISLFIITIDKSVEFLPGDNKEVNIYIL